MNGLRIAVLCVLLPSVAGATVLWRGDLETGDRSQFSHEDMVSADRLQVMRDPVAQGEYALKVTVVQGDNPNGASGNRNEMVKMTNDPEGSEYYYSWSTFFHFDPLLELATKVMVGEFHQGKVHGDTGRVTDGWRTILDCFPAFFKGAKPRYHVRATRGLFKGLRLTLRVSFEDNGCSEGKMRQQTIL